jgi:hypothetical protein
MNKGGFSWKRLTGVTKIKQKISRKTGVPLTKSGRQRKLGGMIYKGKGCLIVILGPLLITLILISATIITLYQDNDSKELESRPELTYTVVDEDVYDAPVVTRVAQRIVISGNVTKANISNLLKNIYENISKRKGFKYNTHPDSIFIWAYTSNEKEQDNYWIAMISKSPSEDAPSIAFDETELNLINAKEEEINGLSEKKRKEIYKVVYSSYVQAEDEGDRLYPIDDPSLSLEQMQKQIELSRAYSNMIKNKKNKEIIAKYSITSEQIEEILNEGLIKHWAEK